MGELKLNPFPTIPRTDKPLLVIVLDGWGEAREDQYNAIYMAKTPCMDSLKKLAPKRWRLLKAHGDAVGLPTDDDMGNSEVGHNALGSGQVVAQGAKLVDQAIQSGQIFESAGWRYIQQGFSEHTLHLIGLLSDGGVHSRLDQLEGLLHGAVKTGAKRIRVHTLTDGRDCEDGSSIPLMKQLVEVLEKLKALGTDARVASGGGRMKVTMDRYESDWKIVERGWDAAVLGEAPHHFKDPVQALETLKKPKEAGGRPVSDQWIDPFVIVDDNDQPVGPIEDSDSVVIFNFRADRVVEISKAFEYKDFKAFDRKRWPKVYFAGLMQYDGELKLPEHYLVDPPVIHQVTGQYMVANGLSTYAVSESQKIGHVTFFWNGNRAAPFDPKLETFHEVPSDQGIPFNEKPAMKSAEITELAIGALNSGKYNEVRVNFPNPDMVGHTGDLDATIYACGVVDQCVQKLLDAADHVGGRWLVTADHGNADDMVQRNKKSGEALKDGDGKVIPLTSHTLSPVPVAIGGTGLPEAVHFREDLPNAGLANVGPTLLNMLGLEAPSTMVPSLIDQS